MSSFWLALPKLIAIALAIIQFIRSANAKGQAVDSIIAEVLQKALKEIEAAAAVEANAKVEHDKHPDDDSGFDPTYRRD